MKCHYTNFYIFLIFNKTICAVAMDLNATLNILNRDNTVGFRSVIGNLTAGDDSLKYLPGVFLVESVAFLSYLI